MYYQCKAFRLKMVPYIVKLDCENPPITEPHLYIFTLKKKNLIFLTSRENDCVHHIEQIPENSLCVCVYLLETYCTVKKKNALLILLFCSHIWPFGLPGSLVNLPAVSQILVWY